MLNFFKSLLSDLFLFTTSYSNNLFPEPLSKKEEEECVQKTLLGDKDARNKLIEHNLRLVAHIVKKYDHRKEDEDDLISIDKIVRQNEIIAQYAQGLKETFDDDILLSNLEYSVLVCSNGNYIIGSSDLEYSSNLCN